MYQRLQALFIDQGPISHADDRRVFIVVGFMDLKPRSTRSAGMIDITLTITPNGGARLALSSPYPCPDLHAGEPIDQLAYHHCLTEEIWRRPARSDQPRHIGIGQILHRPTRVKSQEAHANSFAGILIQDRDAPEPVCHHRYTFVPTPFGELSAGTPKAVPAFAQCAGVYPDYYLMQPGWNFDGKDMGLQSTLGVEAVGDLDQLRRADALGQTSSLLDSLREKRHSLFAAGRKDQDFLAWQSLYAKECAAVGIDPYDHLTPLTAAQKEARHQAAERAVRRLRTSL